AAAHHQVWKRFPGQPYARRQVVAVRPDARARNTAGPDLHQRSGCGVKCRHAVEWIDWRRIVFVAQPEIQSHGGNELPVVLHVCVVSSGAERFRVVKCGLDSEGGISKQQVLDTRSCDSPREGERAARKIIEKAVQADVTDLAPEFYVMAAKDE